MWPIILALGLVTFNLKTSEWGFLEPEICKKREGKQLQVFFLKKRMMQQDSRVLHIGFALEKYNFRPYYVKWSLFSSNTGRSSVQYQQWRTLIPWKNFVSIM